MIRRRGTSIGRRLVWIPLVIIMLSFGQKASAQALTNDDVIKMAQAQLPGSVIIAKIRSSKNDFDTSPDALIRLKQAGVSDSVLSAMTETVAPPTSSGPIAGGLGVPQPTASALPTQYGYYLQQGDKFNPIVTTPITMVYGLRGVAVDGVSGEPSLQLSDATPTFLFYQQNVDIQAAFYGPAIFVSSMQAGQFNIAGTSPELFPAVSGRNYNDVIPVNLWRPMEGERFAVEPVVERPGMFELRMQQPLSPGRYISFFGNTMHMAGTVFATSQNESFSALFFEVPLVCADFNTCATAANAALRSLQRSVATAAWDKALRFGGPITFAMCHERGLSACEKGNLLLDPKEVSFTTTTGQKLFTASPSEVTSIRAMQILGTTYLRLTSKGKNYNLDFLPTGIVCEVKSLVKCPIEGATQQSTVDDYLSITVPKLASGALAPPPAQTTAAPSSDR